MAQPLEGVSASQRAWGRRCSGVTVCFVCVCCRRLRGQLGPRAAREGLDVAEAARAALGSTPWVCCSEGCRVVRPSTIVDANCVERRRRVGRLLLFLN